MSQERLDKLLSSTGLWSRREVKELVRQGRVLAGGAERYAVVLDDRCKITGLSPGDAVRAVQAQGAGGDAALTRRVKELESSNAGLLARASAAEAQSAEAARRAAQYLKRIKAAAAALEVQAGGL